MVKIKSIFVSPLWGKIFNRHNFTKGVILFIVGFITRFFVAGLFGVNIFEVNVFMEFTSYISLVYYSLMTIFGVLIHELVMYFDFCIIPKIVIDFFVNIPNINLNCLRLSTIKNTVSYYFNINKINLTNNDSIINNVSSEDDIKVVTTLMKKNIGSSSNNTNLGKNVVGSSNGESSRVNDNQSNSNSLNNPVNDIIVDSDIENSKTPVSFIMGRGSVEGIECIPSRPKVNYNTKPVFNPYNEKTLRQTDSNSLLSTIPSMPVTPKAGNLSTPDLDGNSVRYPFFGDDISGITPSEICTPRISISQNDENPNYSSNVSTSIFTNDTNHGTVGSEDYNLPHLDMRLNGIRNNMDIISSFEPQNLGDVDLDYRKCKINNAVTNHYKNLNYGRKLIENDLNNNPLSSNNDGVVTSSNFVIDELPVHKKGLKGKLQIGFKYLGSEINKSFNKLDSVYVHYHDVTKRHFYWSVWEKKRGTYSSYIDFKKDWDSNTSVWEAIKCKLRVDLKGDVERLVHDKDPFNRRLNTRNTERIIYKSKKR